MNCFISTATNFIILIISLVYMIIIKSNCDKFKQVQDDYDENSIEFKNTLYKIYSNNNNSISKNFFVKRPSPLAMSNKNKNKNNNNNSDVENKKHCHDSRILELQKDIFTEEQLNDCEEMLKDFKSETVQTDSSMSNLARKGIIAKIIMAPYNDFQLHHYDNFADLKHSGGPSANQETCLKQLKFLLRLAEIEKTKKYSSKLINFQDLLDSFGRTPSGLLQGKLMWTGQYKQCLNVELNFNKLINNTNSHSDFDDDADFRYDSSIGHTRYCLASIRLRDWPKNSPMDNYAAIKIGVCLPKACDSINYKNKYYLIRKLMDFNSRDIDKDDHELFDLYCLPDEQSPLRMWRQSPKVIVTLILLLIWLMVLIYSTIKYNSIIKSTFNYDKNKSVIMKRKSFGMIESLDNNNLPSKYKEDYYLKIYESLSIINNFKSLIRVNKESSLMNIVDKKKVSVDEGIEIDLKMELEIEKLKQNTKLVDLNILEGIKVISTSYVVMGHILMFIPIVVQDGHDFISNTSAAFYLANMAPAFAVNTFFTITGILTSYLLFKQNKTQSFILSPIKWLAFIMYRYLRIMPMYLLVVVYAKVLAKYASSGPFWDYGTSSMGHRKNCEQESWLWTLLFVSNFKSPLKHCIISAWYLANDFQFFIITPIFSILLYKLPNFGKFFIKLCIILGYVAGFISIYKTELSDLRPIASFKPHGFTMYITFLYSNYTQPQFRIPAYLCGLLCGYALYQYEEEKLNYLINQLKQKFKNRHNDYYNNKQEPGWSEFFLNYGPLVSLLFIGICVANPVVASLITFSKFGARLSVAVAMPLYHIMFSLAIGFYVLLASTGYGNKKMNKFLSLLIWKPLARLCLCVVLINMDVISYIIQSMQTTQNIGTIFHFSLNVFCLFVTYALAVIVCVLFEAPTRALLNQLLAFVMTRAAAKSKSESISKFNSSSIEGVSEYRKNK